MQEGKELAMILLSIHSYTEIENKAGIINNFYQTFEILLEIQCKIVEI